MMFVRSKVTSHLLVCAPCGQREGAVESGAGQAIQAKGSTRTADSTELTLQLKLKKTQGDIGDRLAAIDGVSSAILVEYTGDI